MKQRIIATQTAILWLAVVAAALLRFGGLGTAPLTDGEAELALQALQIAQGKAAVIQAYPLEVMVSAGLFFLFGSSNFLARFFAAASGTLLILAIISQRRRLGPSLTLVLALALAFDPALVAQSRQMGSVMPALATLSAMALFAAQGRWSLTGIALGFGILSGPPFWYGSLVLLLAGFAFSALEKRLSSASETPWLLGGQAWLVANAWQTIGVATVLTILFGSTLFFFYPRGLGASVSPLLTFLAGWKAAASVSIPEILLSLGVYQLPAIVFGSIGVGRWILRPQKNERPNDLRLQRFLGIWIGMAALLVLVYPARQMSNLIWVILPLWVYAAQEIAYWVEKLEQPLWATWTLAGITFVFLCLFWLQLAAYTSLLAYGAADWLRLASVFSSLVLIALFVWLAEMVLPARLAWQGMLLGFLVAFSLYTISNVWGMAFSYPWSQVFRQELWKPYPQIGDADLLLKTVQDLSRWKTGRADSLPVLIALDSPAVRWLLRHQHTVTILPEEQALAQLSLRQADQLPALMITPAIAENPSFAAAYRGQDFNWRYQPNWQSLSLSPLNWLLFRKGTWEIQPLILWARSDLFPEGQSLNAGAGGTLPQELPLEEELPLEQP
ncbi:MAG: hypothetical protein DDG59_07900 [Anaerolineae bacterium]|nr:MAG: hypothetical protein DDG59_07900 [Anaerolineae bacterium]